MNIKILIDIAIIVFWLGVFSPAFACNDLACVRKHIDQINLKIVALLAERTTYVRQAAVIKSPSHIANDNARVAYEIKKIKALSLQKNVPQAITIPTFMALIHSSIKYEQSLMDS